MFPLMIKFLLGAEIELEPEKSTDESAEDASGTKTENASSTSLSLLTQRRRWTSMQIREFSELHTAIAHLILSCNLASLREENGKDFTNFHLLLLIYVIFLLCF